MAHDIFLKNSNRDWSRGCESSTSGLEPYARRLFQNNRCAEQARPIVVQQEAPRIGWLGLTLGIMFSTRVLSGHWPWYWFKTPAEKLSK